MNEDLKDIPPLAVVEKLAKIVSGYRSSGEERCVFRSISDTFYRENFHSDILAYYLEDPLAKGKLIDWLNENKDENNQLRFSEYEGGKVLREDKHIDILLLSNDGSQAIVIESKSNEAGDGPRQLPKYVEALRNSNIRTTAILYLTHSKTKQSPPTEEWSLEEIEKVVPLICSATLVGRGSITEKLIDQVLLESNDIRLSGVSLEIKKLFHILVYGDMNMHTMAEFAEELQKDVKKYDQLKEIIKAYNDLPRFWRDTYKKRIDAEYQSKISPGGILNIGTHQETCVYVDCVLPDSKPIAIDLVFSHEHGVQFFLVARDGYHEEELDKVKADLGDKWPFSNKLDERKKRYFSPERTSPLSPFAEEEVLTVLRKILVNLGVKIPLTIIEGTQK